MCLHLARVRPRGGADDIRLAAFIVSMEETGQALYVVAPNAGGNGGDRQGHATISLDPSDESRKVDFTSWVPPAETAAYLRSRCGCRHDQGDGRHRQRVDHRRQRTLLVRYRQDAGGVDGAASLQRKPDPELGRGSCGDGANVARVERGILVSPGQLPGECQAARCAGPKRHRHNRVAGRNADRLSRRRQRRSRPRRDDLPVGYAQRPLANRRQVRRSGTACWACVGSYWDF